MAFDGSGGYTLTNSGYSGDTLWTQAANASEKVRADRFDAFSVDLKNALELCRLRDGQNSPTANLPMGGRKHTGVADATADTEYATKGQMDTAIAGAAITFNVNDVTAVATSLAADDAFVIADGSNNNENRKISSAAMRSYFGGRTALYTVASNGEWSNSTNTFSIPVTDIDGYTYITIAFWSDDDGSPQNSSTVTVLRSTINVDTTLTSNNNVLLRAGSTGLFCGRNTDGTSLYFKPATAQIDTGKIVGVFGGAF